MYHKQNYVARQISLKKLLAGLFFIFCCQFSFSQSKFLALPKGSPQVITDGSNLIIENLSFTNPSGDILQFYRSSNITIQNCYFGASLGEAISLEGCSNITIENCLFSNNRTGVYAVSSKGIKVNNNQFINAHGPMPRGQYVQFNTVTGAGNSISGNRGECFKGESYPEDLINMYKSSGTAASPISITGNYFRGGGPSASGGGILGGDFGGDWIRIENNLLVDPGNYGIATAGGNNITLNANKVHSQQYSYTNAGLIIWAQGGVACSNIAATNNQINWAYKLGGQNNYFMGGGCGNIDLSSNTWNQTLASMNFPAQLITDVTEDELWQIRDQSQQFRTTATAANTDNPWLSRPTANAGKDTSISKSTITLTGSGGGSYKWVQVSGPNSAIITGAASATINLSGLIDGVYTFRLQVTNNENAADADWVVVTVKNGQPAPNQLPIANAGAAVTITQPVSTATLNGSQSADPDGTIASYQWSQVSGPTNATITNSNQSIAIISGLILGIYSFRLTVKDNKEATASATVNVTVNAASNQFPVAHAGAALSITLPVSTTTLNGNQSADPDGTIASYQWSQVSGPTNATITNSNQSIATVSGLILGDYAFQLTVKDNHQAMAKDTVTIAVINNSGDHLQNWILYPNPASDKINFKLYSEKYSKAQITVYDAGGRKILYAGEVNNLQSQVLKTIDISALKAGAYLMQVILDNKERITLKFIKQ